MSHDAARRTERPPGMPGEPEDGTAELDYALGVPDAVRRFRLIVAEGAARGLQWESSGDRCSVGSHPSNDLVLDDPAVSRFHCELVVDRRGARVRDLGSLNGTTVDGTRVVEAFLRDGSIVRVGRTALAFELEKQHNQIAISERRQLGGLIGESVAMRAAFALLERVAATDSTVLLEGETGTGKELAAEGIHLESSRADGPLVVVDCGAVPPNLLESLLFGHERGAFTGADQRRTGAFEEANGGTIFLDEIGELPLELQPKLLRALERRQIQRVGSSAMRAVDVRIVAATNRDLRAMVNAGAFRADLYYRLAVVRVRLPALRERPEDIPGLVVHFLHALGAPPEAKSRLSGREFVASLQRAAWPGNVRELRNALERSIVLDKNAFEQASAPGPTDAAVPYEEARRRAIDDFEARYLSSLLAAHRDNVSRAARAGGVGRVYLHRLLKKHGLR